MEVSIRAHTNKVSSCKRVEIVYVFFLFVNASISLRFFCELKLKFWMDFFDNRLDYCSNDLWNIAQYTISIQESIFDFQLHCKHLLLIRVH